MKIIFAAYIFLLFVLPLNAQQALPDSAVLLQSVSNTLLAYKSEMGNNLHVFNGALYLRGGHGVKGTPFFITDSLLNSTVLYDGGRYESVPLHYDLVTDAVVTPSFNKQQEIKLVPEKLPWFSIAGHSFVRIVADSTTPSFITTGYYEKLYDGPLMVLARRQKIARLSGSLSDGETRYELYNNYFVQVNNAFYRADDKSDFLAATGYKKELIGKFIKDSSINFKKDRETAMARVAAYYAQLKN